MPEIFVISDTHFGHENIIKYCNRPFKNAEEMNWELVKRWNNVVTPQDKVYHLGDVHMGGKSREQINQVLSALNGHKRLILGNHDNGKDQLLLNHFEKITMWRAFKEFGLLLTHAPVHESTLVFGSFKAKNVHGHIHQNKSPSGPYINVSVEAIDYTPINIKTLMET